MATTKITSPDLFDLGSLNTALQLPSGTTAERPASPSTGEWRYNTTTNLVEYYDGAAWRDLQSEDIPPVPSENFNTVLWTGNGSGQSITGVGYAPDFVWLKNRDQNNYSHRIFDTSRGPLKVIKPSGTGAESTDAGSLTSFDSDGFTLGNDVYVNNSGDDFVGWTMKANGGTTSSNTDGTNTSTVQVNSTAKFSIVEWNGGVAEHSVGHGLGVKPEVVIIKELGASSNWNVYYDVVDGSLDFATLNNDNAGANSSRTMWTSSVFYWSGTTTTDCVAYCFTSVAEYSKIGSYTGNGSTEGTIVETGFEPAFLLIKRTSNTADWVLLDNKRTPSNPRNKYLTPNTSDAETTSDRANFLSNGFQLITTGANVNFNGDTYIYIAFASDSSTAPVLANSFGLSLYTGDGASGNSITGLGFQPSFVWIKSRSGTIADWSHALMDAVRNSSSSVSSNTTGAEVTNTNGLESFDADGFTVGSAAGGWNYSGSNYVAWNWKANSIPTINTDGTIQSVVSANQAAGISIVKYIGDGSTSATIGHGLSSAPEMVMVKNLTSTDNWIVYNQYADASPASGFLQLNSTAAFYSDSDAWGGGSGTEPTSTLVTIGDGGTDGYTNQNGSAYIAYCFHSVSGFSKFGSYSGSASAVTVTTGFQPDYVLIKNVDAVRRWPIFDYARSDFGSYLDASDSLAEQTDSTIEISVTSTGFVLPAGANYTINSSGYDYIYMAFKKNYSIPETQMGYLSVAGGGGASRDSGGGGGAGGLRTSWGSSSGGGSSIESNITLAAGTYTITVGSGGNITNGNTSSIAGPSLTTISCVGGGVGSGADNSYAAGTGGSGGGGAGGSYSNSGGSGTANQGYSGGSSASVNTGLTCFPGAGGGGASAGGGGVSRNDDTNAGNGGAGLSVDITGTGVFYAGGGGGAINNCAGATAGTGGSGGGGTGSIGGGTSNATDGATNTGGGAGGGSGAGTQGLGGSGVVILRLKTSVYTGTTTGSPTVTTDGSDTILTYTGSGTYVHS